MKPGDLVSSGIDRSVWTSPDADKFQIHGRMKKGEIAIVLSVEGLIAEVPMIRVVSSDGCVGWVSTGLLEVVGEIG